ncbi:MAG: hypothetical protein P8009_01165 [Gammaproteobacteria bacterium]
MHHEAQVREHQLPGGIQIAVALQAHRQIAFLFGAEHRDRVDGLGVGLQAAGRDGELQFQALGHGIAYPHSIRF